MKFSHNNLVRGLQVINHLLLLLGLYHVIATQEWRWLLVSLLTYWVVGILGINIGYHRLLSHRSFKTNIFWEQLLSVIGCITVVGSPLAWVTVHRQHHRAADTQQDPHSPFVVGSAHAWFGFWQTIKYSPRLVRDLRSHSFQRMLHNNYFSILMFYCVLLGALNPWFIVFVFAIPACLCLHSSSAIIVIAHRHGYKSHAVNDQSRNSWIANLITMGEGWHNNHHAAPWKWSNWEKWWEWDIPSLIIRMIKK